MQHREWYETESEYEARSERLRVNPVTENKSSHVADLI